MSAVSSFRRKRIARVPIGLAIPFALVFLFFFVVPFFYSLYLSLFVQKGTTNHFVGLHNYLVAWQDTDFWLALLRVLWYGVLQVIVMLVIALGVALLLDSPYVKSKSLFRLIYFLPYAVPGVIAALMWGFLYSPQLNHLISVLSVFNGGHPVTILSSGNLLYAIVNMVVWETTGYNMTIYFASLTSVPLEVYEAARLDGASEWRIAMQIKVPLIRSTVIMTMVLSMIASLQLFNEPYVLSPIVSVPWNYTPNMEIFNMAFTYGNFTYSATLSIILALITFVLSLLFMLVTGSQRRRRPPKTDKAASGAPSPASAASSREPLQVAS